MTTSEIVKVRDLPPNITIKPIDTLTDILYNSNTLHLARKAKKLTHKSLRKKDILEELHKIDVQIDFIQNWLQSAPCGEIQVHRRGSKQWYGLRFLDSSGQMKEQYISIKNDKTIISLLKKRYYKRLLPLLEDERAALSYFYTHCHTDEKVLLYRQLPEEHRLRIEPLESDIEMIARQWEKEKYESNQYPFPEVFYTTSTGRKLRSRAEFIIATTLEKYQLPMRCEEKLELFPGKYVYPDFSVMSPSGHIYNIEFFGMMGNPEYAKRAFQKIQLYHKSKYAAYFIPIFDYPEQPFDPLEFEAIINNVILADTL